MIICPITKCRRGESVQVELPRRNMIIDPYANNKRECSFECVYHDDGTTVTLRRADGERYRGVLTVRVYDPATEGVPDFDSTTYNYLGVDGETAPLHTTVLLIDPSVKHIEERAFIDCRVMKKCIMHDGVHTIGKNAFGRCVSIKLIRLSRNLKCIKEGAFHGCKSLDSLFLPSDLERVETSAFIRCTNIRILPLPLNIEIQNFGKAMLWNCDTLFRVTHIPRRYGIPDEEISHQSILDLYRNLPPLHKACLDTKVSAQIIHDCIDAYGTEVANITDHDGMTPLHILAMNPFASAGVILAYFNMNMSAAFAGDSRRNNVLDYLREYNLEAHTLVVTALCMNRDMMMECREQDQS